MYSLRLDAVGYFVSPNGSDVYFDGNIDLSPTATISWVGSEATKYEMA